MLNAENFIYAAYAEKAEAEKSVVCVIVLSGEK
jgi:hypothetical protein